MAALRRVLSHRAAHNLESSSWVLSITIKGIALKKFTVMQNVGKARHVVSFHDGVTVHGDNSPFFDMRIFGRKTDLVKFVKELESAGYVKA